MGKKNKSQKQNSDASVSEKDAKSHDRKRVITDERFTKVHSDPRFQKVPKHKAKVAIGSRFSAMLTNKHFAASSAPLDKRGKRKKGSSENALHRYYSLEEEDDREEEKKKNIGKEKGGDEGRRKGKAEMKEEESDEFDCDSTDLESDDELEPLKSKSKDDVDDDEEESKDDFGDGDNDEEEVDMENDATSSTTDSDDEGDADLEDDDSVEVENVPTIEKETHRLAIVNMDWSHVKAADLFVMLSSFLPKGGQILSVSVYPSEFGIKRMEEEALRGPAALFDGEEENKDKDTDDDDDDEIDDEKLRAYEISRLRYYYAVVVCDSVATADYLYKSCDGVEFERSSNILDVRFIPDDMEFKHPPRDQATEAPTVYEALDFHTPALQHTNVHISWDEDEPRRVKTLNRKFNADQLADLEVKEFLASDESESEEDVDEAEDLSERKNRKRDKYRALIQSGGGSEEEDEEDDERQEMEVTFNTGLEGLSKKILAKKDSKSETVWETNLRKRKEKHKKRSKDSSDDENDDFSDKGPREEPDDFFEEEPPTKKTKKKRSEIESMEREKEASASQAELELLVADDKEANNNMKGYKIKREKVKWKKGKKEALAEDKLPTVNLDDPRFAVKLNKPLFSLDPTHSEYKRSVTYARWSAKQSQKDQEGMDEELSSINKKSGSEPIKKQGNDEDTHLKSDKSTSNDKHELSMLVKSIKMKSKEVRLPSDNAKMKGSSTGKKQK